MTEPAILIPDTDAVPRTYAIHALRYFHPDPDWLKMIDAWDSWILTYPAHLAAIPLVAHTGTDNLWVRLAETGVWVPATEVNGTRPNSALDSLLRTLVAQMVRCVPTENGVRQYLIAATPHLLSNIAREMITLLKAADRCVTTLDIQSLDGTPLPCPVPHILPASNGILDVMTNTLHPYTENIFVASIFPTEFRPDLAPLLDDWIYLKNTRDSIRNETDQQMMLLQELMGYSMGFDRSIRGAIAFRGVSGSGKGSTLALLRRTIGAAFQPFTLRALGSDTEVGRSAIIQQASTARIMADLDAVSPATLRSQSLTADIKTMSDFDDVTWRVSRAPTASVTRWGAMIIMATNELIPRWTDTSNAIANRFRTITFDHGTNARRRENGGVGGEDYSYRAALNDDPNHPELFLLWAAEGLKRVILNQGFTESSQNENQRLEAQLHVIPVETWIESEIVLTGNPADFIPTQRLLLAMWGWLHDQDVSFHKIKPALQSIPRLLTDAGIAESCNVARAVRRMAGYRDLSDRTSSASEGSPQVRGMCGIQFRHPPDPMQQWDALKSLDASTYRSLAITRDGLVPTSYTEFVRLIDAPLESAYGAETGGDPPPYPRMN